MISEPYHEIFTLVFDLPFEWPPIATYGSDFLANLKVFGNINPHDS